MYAYKESNLFKFSTHVYKVSRSKHVGNSGTHIRGKFFDKYFNNKNYNLIPEARMKGVEL